ncbi:MAG: PPC domain-containing protein [Haloarculaceae archaeon]
MRGQDSRVTVRRVVVASVVALLVAGALGPVAGGLLTPDEEEPNDSREEAQEVPVGETVTGELPEEDRDWFAFTVERGVIVNVTASTADGDRGTDFTLRDPDGDKVGGTRLGGGRDYFGTTAAPGGTYFVTTVGVSPGQGGVPYEFTVETSRTDDFEPNEERKNATEVGVGETISGEVSVGDRDWFAFTVEAGETINVTAAAEDRRGTEFNLVTPDGDGIEGTRLSGGRDYFGTTAVTSGTYYVQTLGVSPGRGGGEYNFTVETYRTDGFEPNEDRGNATRLYENPFVPSVARLSVGDREWFSFPVDAGETVNVSAAAGERRGTEFNLLTPDGDNVAGERLGGERAAFGTTAETGGTYYLQTIGVSPSRGGDEYNFSVDVGGETLGLPNDRFERGNPPVGNNDRTNASDVQPGTFTDLGMVDDDRDVFAVDLLEGERVLVSAEFTHAENDLAIELVDASGSAVASADSDSDGESLAYTADADGTYYLQVTGETGAATRYGLNLTVVHPVTVTVGPGDGTIAPANTTTFDVVVSNVNGGLTGGTFAFRSTDGSVVTVQSVAAPTGSASADVAEDGANATATVTGLDPEVCGNVPVARVTVESVESGEATLGAGVTLSGNEGHVYRVESVRNTTLSVDPAGGTSVDGAVSSETQPCPLDRAASTPAVTESGGSDSGSESGGTDQSEGTSNGLGPGFGPLAALVALAAASLLVRRRR